MDASPSLAAGPSRLPATPAPGCRDTIRAASYSYRAPSPPFIHVPMAQHNSSGGQLDLMPSLEHADTTRLTSADLAIITRNATQVARDRAASWTYEQRRQAQPMLDFLYLGPTSVVRDHAFLAAEGITMVLVARDARMAGARLLGLEGARAALGVDARVLDVDGTQGLVRAYPEAVGLINDHLLDVYRARAPGAAFRHGKVLVACESGNDRSAGIVAAYIMAMFGKSMVPTLQFISVQRFCCSFDEEAKRTLQTWEDILKARNAVARAGAGARAKRGVDDMMAVDDEDAADDVERFTDRASFAPFRDASTP